MTWLAVAIAGTALILLIGWLLDVSRDAEAARSFDSVAQRARRPGREQPHSRVVAQRLVANAVTAGGLYFRVRPVITEIAVTRLARRGITLDDPRAAELLGEAAWSLLRPDARPPKERMAPGLKPAELGAIVARLEAL